jgi:hypothetical protein
MVATYPVKVSYDDAGVYTQVLSMICQKHCLREGKGRAWVFLTMLTHGQTSWGCINCERPSHLGVHFVCCQLQ